MSLTALDLVAAAKQHILEISPVEAKPLLDRVKILDVREPSEFAAGRLPGAINIPRGVLEFQIGSHPALGADKNAEILVYCLSGGRSALAVESLKKLGYGQAVSLAGGFKAWSEAGQPIDA